MKVVVARIIGNHEVTAFASDEIIGAQMEIESFLHILAYEAGDEKLAERLIAALPKTLLLMKQETAKVVL